MFCERIFGPTKDINPHDSKLKGVRSREAAVDKEGNLVEIFTHTSKGGICSANLNSNTRLISLALRSGVKIDEIDSKIIELFEERIKEAKSLLEKAEVTKVSANHDKSHIRIYLLAQRLIDKKKIWYLENTHLFRL